MSTFRLAMGLDRSRRGRLLASCCHGAFYGFGFVFTVLAFIVMFWIAWCYFGLAVIQSSDGQRRAATDWSNAKPPLISTTTSSPLRSSTTTSAVGETSSNAISKLPTTSDSLLRGSSRVASTVPSPRGLPKSNREETGAKASAILTGSEESEEDRIYARRVLPPGPENRPEEKGTTGDRYRPDISPTKVYDSVLNSETPRTEKTPVRASETRPSDYPDRGSSIQSSRRPDAEPATAYRDPDFDREYPRVSTSYVRSDPRYDEPDDDERGSRGRYDKRDRGRQSDDRLSKGDTRVYPDDRDPGTDRDDRYYSTRERYPDDEPRRGDDDRYDDRYKDRPRYRDRDFDDKPLPPSRDDRYKDDRYRDDRYRDDDRRYSTRNDKYEADDRYRSRDGDRYDNGKPKPRDDGYRSRDDDSYRYRDDERYRDEDRSRVRDDDRSRVRDDNRSRVRDDERYKATRDDDRYRSDPPRGDDYRPRDDSSRSRIRDTESLPADDRRPSSSRSGYDTRVDETALDYDRSRTQTRDDVSPSRVSRPLYEEDRYRQRDREDSYIRPSRYDDEDRQIAPTRTRSEYSLSKSSLIDPRPRESGGSSRYIVDERDKPKEDGYYDQDRGTRLQGSRGSSPVSESSRRYSDDDIDRYRTRLPSDRKDDPKGREEVVIDRRSYASDETDEYRRRGNSRFGDEYDDRPRRPVDEPRRYKDEEGYPRRDPIDDRSRVRDDYERDRSSSRRRDRYDDEYRRYDDRYPVRDDKLPPLPMRKYDTYDDGERSTDVGTIRKEGTTRDREENLRPSSSYRDEQRSASRAEYTDSKSSSRRRYDDDLSLDSRDEDDRYSRGSRKPANVDAPSTSGLREPADVMIREKRFPISDDRQSGDSNRRYYDDGTQVRPLSAKDVIEAAKWHSDGTDQNARKVYYPVFDPRLSNLTSPEIIRPSERRGTTITAKKRRSALYYFND